MSEDQDKGGELRLEAIVDYEMTPLEAKAYKLTLLWLDKSRSLFPTYAHAKMRKGDPRKSQIFKFCYKLTRETQGGILEESDYPLYVRAQLEILKHITRGSEHAMIDPHCLAGDKAWVRWKLWKRKYNDRLKVIENQVPIPANQIKMAEALDRTKEFLVKTFGSEISVEKIQESVVNKNFQRWIVLGKISPYYLVLSPLLEKAFPDGVDKIVTNDLSIYRQVITEQICSYFKEAFKNEF